MINIINKNGSIVNFIWLICWVVLFARAGGNLGYLIKRRLYQIMDKYVQIVIFFSRWAVVDPLKGMKNVFGILFYFHAKSYCQTARYAWVIKLHIEEYLSPYLAMVCWTQSLIALYFIKMPELRLFILKHVMTSKIRWFLIGTFACSKEPKIFMKMEFFVSRSTLSMMGSILSIKISFFLYGKTFHISKWMHHFCIFKITIFTWA